MLDVTQRELTNATENGLKKAPEVKSAVSLSMAKEWAPEGTFRIDASPKGKI